MGKETTGNRYEYREFSESDETLIPANGWDYYFQKRGESSVYRRPIAEEQTPYTPKEISAIKAMAKRCDMDTPAEALGLVKQETTGNRYEYLEVTTEDAVQQGIHFNGWESVVFREGIHLYRRPISEAEQTPAEAQEIHTPSGITNMQANYKNLRSFVQDIADAGGFTGAAAKGVLEDCDAIR